MRLSGIKLAGFKSFVDPTHLALPSNLTSVVGPNGCGKSNLIDAVRWVLGESSMKNLRGADAEDVIFNGSKTRKPIGRASVELIFDNSDGQVSGTYAAYNEISVRRELTRDGGSQYLLNGRKCLKRDVTDLFLGTGLGGKRQYAIIEQGMVSRMVEARPEELRQWLEEAAGISKYKERRRETEGRIRSTRENLARLNDLRSELDARVQSLVRQAANAEKYTTLKADERRLRAELLLIRTRQVEAECSAIAAQLEAEQQRLAAAGVALEQARQQRRSAEAVLREAEAAANAEQGKVYEAEAGRSQAQQALAHTEALRDLEGQEREALARRVDEAAQRGQSLEQGLARAEHSLTDLQQRVTAAEAAERDAQAALGRQEAQLAEAQADWDQFTQAAEAPLARTESERVRLQSLERAHSHAAARLSRLAEETGTLDVEALQRAVAQAADEAELASTSLDEGRSERAALETRLGEVRDARKTDEDALHQYRQRLQAVDGQLASLETLQAAALRKDDGALAQWLNHQDLGAAPKLADQLDVRAGWEAAVEQVLAALLEAPVAPAAATGALTAEGPERGIAVVTEGAFGNAGPDHDADGAPLSGYVRGPAAVHDWLRGIVAVDSFVQLRHHQSRLRPGQSCITPDGIWAGADWIRYPRRDQGQTGVIERRRALESLAAERTTCAAQVDDIADRLAQSLTVMQSLEAERRAVVQAVEQTQSRHAQILARQQSLQVRLEQTQQRLSRLEQERQATQQQLDEAERELGSTRAGLVVLDDEAQRLRARRTEHQQALATRRQQAQQARAAAQVAGQHRQKLAVDHAGAQSSLTALQNSLVAAREQLDDLRAQLAARSERAEGWAGPLAEQARALANAEQTLSTRREQLRERRQAVEAAEQALQQAQTALQQAEGQREHHAEAVQGGQLKAENGRTRGEALAAQLADSGFSRDQLETTLDPAATLESGEEALNAVTRRIERLGAINLAAIQELEDATTRAAYLEAQHADLTGALETLEAAMHKIDQETKTLFRDTFDRVNAVFTDRFPKLFGGGEATLELIGDDLLDAGVRVMARPPGKRNATIQMLSGGEKAMTAVALLLGLFELNPAPFCLMDEVDAPLDDANVTRFCDVVREMSARVQFIIITHNKITMELAAQLHGVTMQEPGVSRLVSVDVDQAVALTEAA
jgi:chromosome segregation protein